MSDLVADIGGGASLTTDPAAGTSTGTDVSLKEHALALAEKDVQRLEELAVERDKRYCERNRRQDDAMKHMEAISEQARKDDKEAVRTAFSASTELAKSHNDLLRKMEKLTETFATREGTVELIDRHERLIEDRLRRIESFQNKLMGALVLVSFLVTGNFVKVWLG